MTGRNGLLKSYLEFPVIYKIFIGFVLGVIAGVLLGPSIMVIRPLGEAFIRLLSMVALPLIVFTLIVGASSISPKDLSRIGVKVLGWYLITCFIAAILGVGMGLLIKPGLGSEHLLEEAECTPVEPVDFADMALNWIPGNVFASMAEFDIIPVLIFTLIFGIGLTYVRGSKEPRIKDAGDTLYKVCDAGAEIMYKVVRFVLEVAPFGVFALIAVVIGDTGLGIFAEYARLIAAEAAADGIMIVCVYSGLLLLFGINPLKFLKGVKDPWLVGTVTRTSAGTLPVSMNCAENTFGISKSVYSFSLPLGATMNMDGSASYQTVVAIFACHLAGVQITPVLIATIVLVSVMASIGTASVPSAGLVMLTITLSAVGLPLEVIGLVAGIDVILDMLRTGNNVVGDLAVSNIVSKTENETNWDVGVWK